MDDSLAALSPEGLEAPASNGALVSAERVADVALDLWRIVARIDAEGAPERVRSSVERAQDRVRRLGFELYTPTGATDSNARMRVVEHEPSEGPIEIVACLLPAVYFDGALIRPAEVVTRGGGNLADPASELNEAEPSSDLNPHA